MVRKGKPKKRIILPDPVYNSYLVQRFINNLLKKGKKSIATKIFYQTLNNIEEKTNKDPLEILDQAIRKTTPLIEVKSRRIGGSTYQLPLTVESNRGISLAICWIITAANKRSGKGIVIKLTNEIIDASKNLGLAIRKKEEVHKMAEANKAFAHFRA
uniref:Small ribosomal subunit protein uS7c n=1 Tax=Verdigellas peltata TaxID=542676 RepID=A0A170TNZ1_9VIRI|nr:ribosomal protein S7 [Verdigellas peltata]CZF96668.1 ribosomal protein S7 [Verdigellas peltata]